MAELLNFLEKDMSDFTRFQAFLERLKELVSDLKINELNDSIIVSSKELGRDIVYSPYAEHKGCQIEDGIYLEWTPELADSLYALRAGYEDELKEEKAARGRAYPGTFLHVCKAYAQLKGLIVDIVNYENDSWHVGYKLTNGSGSPIVRRGELFHIKVAIMMEPTRGFVRVRPHKAEWSQAIFDFLAFYNKMYNKYY